MFPPLCPCFGAKMGRSPPRRATTGRRYFVRDAGAELGNGTTLSRPRKDRGKKRQLVIVFSGKRKSGKDYVTDLLLER